MRWLNYHFIAYLSDIPMFYIKYLTMYKVHMHAGAIRKLLYGCEYVRIDNPRAKARELSIRTYAQTIQLTYTCTTGKHESGQSEKILEVST